MVSVKEDSDQEEVVDVVAFSWVKAKKRAERKFKERIRILEKTGDMINARRTKQKLERLQDKE